MSRRFVYTMVGGVVLLVVLLMMLPEDVVQPVQSEVNEMSNQDVVAAALDGLETIEVESLLVNDDNKMVVVTFGMDGDDLWLAEHSLFDMVCVIQEAVQGYGLRAGARMANGVTGMTAHFSAEALAAVDCAGDVPDWASVADEYSAASGLR